MNYEPRVLSLTQTVVITTYAMRGPLEDMTSQIFKNANLFVLFAGIEHGTPFAMYEYNRLKVHFKKFF